MPSVPLSASERRKRSLIVCCNFARNLAVYRTGITDGRHLLDAAMPQSFFWRQINANSIDICILEWCKLFGELNGHHNWSRVISEANRDDFERGLLEAVDMSKAEFASYTRGIREYRDWFVAHLDDERVMNIPELETARESVWHLYGFLAWNECTPEELGDLAHSKRELDVGYEKCVIEAREVFRIAETHIGESE